MNKHISLAAVIVLLLGASGCATQNLKPRSTLAVSAEAPPLRPEIKKRADLMYEVLAGEIAGKLGDLDSAMRHYLEAAELSDDPGLAERTAKVALYAKKYDIALDAVKRWLKLQPDNTDALRMAGALYVEMNEPEKAAEYFGRMIDLAGKDTYAASFAHLNLLLAGENGNESALKTMSLLRERYSNVPEAHETYAEMAFRARNYVEAKTAAEAALKLRPNDLKAQIVRYRSMLALGQVAFALDGMKRLVEKHPKDLALRQNYARMLVQARRYKEALKQYRRMLKSVPDDLDIVYSAALLNIQAGNKAEAKKLLKRLINSATHRNDAFFYLGSLAEEDGKTDEAIEWYSRIHEGEYYFQARSRVATLMAKAGHLKDARSYLAGLRNKADSDAEKIQIDLLEGELIEEFEGPQQAYDYYSQLLEKYPGNAELLYARAMVAEKLDRLDWLERDLKKILEKDRDNTTALNALGYTLADRTDRLDEAYEYIAKAMKLRPDDPAIIDSMGWVKYRQGEISEAKRYLQQAFELAPDAEIAAHLVEVLLKEENTDEAKKVLEEALKVSPADPKLLELQKELR